MVSFISEVPGIMIKAALGLLLLFLIIVIWKGLHQEGYVFQSIQVPKIYSESGLTGIVLSSRLADKVGAMKGSWSSTRTDSLDIQIDNKPDLNIDVMGVGLSSANLTYHIREILGIKSKFITGELIDIDNQLSFTIRMSDGFKETFIVAYRQGGVLRAVDEVVKSAAQMILHKTDAYRLAVYHYYNKEYDEAEQLIRELIRDEPGDRKWAYYLWGYIQSKKGNLVRAAELYELSLAEDNHFQEALRALGWLYFRNGDYTGSQALFNQMSDLDPTDFSTNQGIALTHLRLGQLEESEAYYKRNISNHSENIWSYMNYTFFLLNVRKDSLTAASAWMEASQNIKEKSNYHLALGGYYHLSGKPDSAILCAKRALEYNPENETALMQVAIYEQDINQDHYSSIDLFKRLIRILKTKNFEDGMQQSTLNRLAMSEYKVGALDSARIHVQEAIDLFPQNPYPWTTLAEIYALQNRTGDFFKTLNKAVSLGFDLQTFKNTEIYKDYNADPRFLALLQQDKLKN